LTAQANASQLAAMKNALAARRMSTPFRFTAARNVPSSPVTASQASTNTHDHTMRCAVICMADTLVKPIR
jgi:hypothetical protein